MPKRKRNYKAEYARRKARSLSLGYKSPRQEYQARKAVGLRRGFPSLRLSELPDFAFERVTGNHIKTLRREAQAWSDKHSHVPVSRYSPRMSNAQAEAYHHAFVEYPTTGSRRKKAIEKKRRIHEYLKKYGDYTESEWEQKYERQAV